MSSSDPIVASGENPYESVEEYIPTPNADGSCDPHVRETNLEDWFWVVCGDCSKELVEGKANALAALDDCDGMSS